MIAAFSLVFPDTWPAHVINGIPPVADICAAILSFCACTKVKWASTLRKYFDAYALDLQWARYSEADRREVLEYTEKICRKHPDDLTIQIVNIGYDSPPGLRDWYVFSGYYIGTKAQLECQQQNTWWNKRMVEKRLLLTVILTVLLVLVFWLLSMHYNKLTTSGYVAALKITKDELNGAENVLRMLQNHTLKCWNFRERKSTVFRKIFFAHA